MNQIELENARIREAFGDLGPKLVVKEEEDEKQEEPQDN